MRVPAWVRVLSEAALTARATPKSDDDGVAVLEQDVRGLDVAVDHLLPVGVVERFGRFAREPEGVRQREPPLPVEQVAQRAALDVGRDVVEEAVELARIVERQEVGMPQPGREPDLSQEALRAERLAELRLEHLERDDPVVPLVAGPVHHRHPAAPDLPLDGVAGLEGRPGAGRGDRARAGPGRRSFSEYRPPGRRQGPWDYGLRLPAKPSAIGAGRPMALVLLIPAFRLSEFLGGTSRPEGSTAD